jgi:hypothetical protein
MGTCIATKANGKPCNFKSTWKELCRIHNEQISRVEWKANGRPVTTIHEDGSKTIEYLG